MLILFLFCCFFLFFFFNFKLSSPLLYDWVLSFNLNNWKSLLRCWRPFANTIRLRLRKQFTVTMEDSRCDDQNHRFLNGGCYCLCVASTLSLMLLRARRCLLYWCIGVLAVWLFGCLGAWVLGWWCWSSLIRACSANVIALAYNYYTYIHTGSTISSIWLLLVVAILQLELAFMLLYTLASYQTSLALLLPLLHLFAAILNWSAAGERSIDRSIDCSHSV